MQPDASFPYLRYNPLQIFCRSKTPAALYADKNGCIRLTQKPGKMIFKKRSMRCLQVNLQTVPGTIPLSLPSVLYLACISPSGKKTLRLRGDSNGFCQKKSFQKDTVDRLMDLIGSRSVLLSEALQKASRARAAMYKEQSTIR